VVRASGIAGRAGIAGLPDAATSVFFPEAPDDGESDAQPARTLDALRNTGDPNDVGRTPILGTDDIPVTPGEWPLGYPLQGVPRVAVTLSLQYVYNEAEDQWERDTGFRSSAAGATGARLFQTNPQSVPSGTTTTVDYDATDYDGFGTADPSANRITAPSDGLYYLQASVRLDGVPGETDIDVAILVDGSAVVSDDEIIPTTSSGNLDVTVTTSDIQRLADGDVVTGTVSQNSGGPLSTVAGQGRTFLTTVRVGP